MAGDLTRRALRSGDRVRTRQPITEAHGTHHPAGTEGVVIATMPPAFSFLHVDIGDNTLLRAPATFFEHLIPDLRDREAVEEWLNS